MQNNKLALDYKIGIEFILNNKYNLYLVIDEQEYFDISIRSYANYNKSNDILVQIMADQLAQMLIYFFTSQRVDIKIIGLNFKLQQAQLNDYKFALAHQLKFQQQSLTFRFFTQLSNHDLLSLEILFSEKPMLPKVSLLNINYTNGEHHIKSSEYKQQIRKKSGDLYLVIEIVYKYNTACEIILPRILIYNILRLVLGHQELEIKYNDFYANLIIETICAVLPPTIVDNLTIKDYKYKKLSVGVYEQINCIYKNKLLGYLLAKNVEFLNNELVSMSNMNSEETLLNSNWQVKLPLILGAVELTSTDFETLRPGDVICLDYPIKKVESINTGQLILGNLAYNITLQSDLYTVSGINSL